MREHPGILRIPIHPLETIVSPIWVSDFLPRYYLYGSYHAGTTNIRWSTTIGSGFIESGSGDKFYPVWDWFNGMCYFRSGNNNLWYDSREGVWCRIHPNVGVGIKPSEVWQPTNENEPNIGSYFGSDWYSGGLSGTTISLVGRGSLRGTSLNWNNGGHSLTLTRLVEYYQRDTESSDVAGVYKWKGEGTSPDKIIGVPQYKDQNNKLYVRSLLKGGNDKYTYDEITYNQYLGKWFIGTYNSVSGWYECLTEPNVTSPVTFEFKVPEDSTLTSPDLIITFDKYIVGTNTSTGKTFNVGRWHA